MKNNWKERYEKELVGRTFTIEKQKYTEYIFTKSVLEIGNEHYATIEWENNGRNYSAKDFTCYRCLDVIKNKKVWNILDIKHLLIEKFLYDEG